MSKLIKNSFRDAEILEIFDEPLMAMEAESDDNNIAVYEAAITDCHTVIVSLEEFSGTIETMLNGGGVSLSTLTVVTDGLTNLNNESGIDMGIPSVAMEGLTDEALVLATEALMDTIKAATKTTWRVIIEFIKKIIAAVKLFYDKFFKNSKLIQAGISKLKGAYAAASKAGGEHFKTDIILPANVANKLGVKDGESFIPFRYESQISVLADIKDKLSKDRSLYGMLDAIEIILLIISHNPSIIHDDVVGVIKKELRTAIRLYKLAINIATIGDEGMKLTFFNYSTFNYTLEQTDVQCGAIMVPKITTSINTEINNDNTAEVTVARPEFRSVADTLYQISDSIDYYSKYSRDRQDDFDRHTEKSSKAIAKHLDSINNNTRNVANSDVICLVQTLIDSYQAALTLHTNLTKYVDITFNDSAKAYYNYAVLCYRSLETKVSDDK